MSDTQMIRHANGWNHSKALRCVDCDPPYGLGESAQRIHELEGEVERLRAENEQLREKFGFRESAAPHCLNRLEDGPTCWLSKDHPGDHGAISEGRIVRSWPR